MLPWVGKRSPRMPPVLSEQLGCFVLLMFLLRKDSFSEATAHPKERKEHDPMFSYPHSSDSNKCYLCRI